MSPRLVLDSTRCLNVLLLVAVLGGCVPRRAQVEEQERPEHAASAASPAGARDKLGSPDARPSADPILTEPFEDSFDRPTLGGDWRVAGGAWRLQAGELCVAQARNRPAWLKRRLPLNAVIEFQALTHSSDGDIKAEAWGDGESGAQGTSYDHATSYVLIFGGWKNRYHVLARLDEHAADRSQLQLLPGAEDPRSRPVVARTPYRFRIERRDGKTIRWSVDDVELFTLVDEEPLQGPGHDHFGFNNWSVRLCFDDLRIVPLPS